MVGSLDVIEVGPLMDMLDFVAVQVADGEVAFQNVTRDIKELEDIASTGRIKYDTDCVGVDKGWGFCVTSDVGGLEDNGSADVSEDVLEYWRVSALCEVKWLRNNTLSGEVGEVIDCIGVEGQRVCVQVVVSSCSQSVPDEMCETHVHLPRVCGTVERGDVLDTV